MVKKNFKGKVEKSALCDLGFASTGKYALYDRTTDSYRDSKEEKTWQRDIYSLGVSIYNLFDKKLPKKYRGIVKEMTSDKNRGTRPSISRVRHSLFKEQSRSAPSIHMNYELGKNNTGDFIYPRYNKLKSYSISHSFGSRFKSIIHSSSRSNKSSKVLFKDDNEIDVNNKNVGKKAITDFICRNNIKEDQRGFFLVGLYITSCVFGGKYTESMIRNNLLSLNIEHFS